MLRRDLADMATGGERRNSNHRMRGPGTRKSTGWMKQGRRRPNRPRPPGAEDRRLGPLLGLLRKLDEVFARRPSKSPPIRRSGRCPSITQFRLHIGNRGSVPLRGRRRDRSRPRIVVRQPYSDSSLILERGVQMLQLDSAKGRRSAGIIGPAIIFPGNLVRAQHVGRCSAASSVERRARTAAVPWAWKAGF